jgi:hypothetical protein
MNLRDLWEFGKARGLIVQYSFMSSQVRVPVDEYHENSPETCVVLVDMLKTSDLLKKVLASPREDYPRWILKLQAKEDAERRALTSISLGYIAGYQCIRAYLEECLSE